MEVNVAWVISGVATVTFVLLVFLNFALSVMVIGKYRETHGQFESTGVSIIAACCNLIGFAVTAVVLFTIHPFLLDDLWSRGINMGYWGILVMNGVVGVFIGVYNVRYDRPCDYVATVFILTITIGIIANLVVFHNNI